MDLHAKYENAVFQMQKINNYLAAEIFKLGYPAFTTSIPTAGVGWDEKQKKIIFLFNPEFAETLTDDEFCFVIAHEGIHLVNGHVFLLFNEIERMKKIKKNHQELAIFKKNMNIAMDCVVNDSLVNLYNFPKVLDQDPVISNKVKVFYGQPTVGQDCHDLTAYEVYYMLPDDKTMGDVENHDMWDSFFDSDGSFKKEFVDVFKEMIDRNIQNSSLSDKELAQVHKIKKTMENCSDFHVSQAGRAASSEKRPVDGTDRKTLNWNKILYKFVDTLKPEDIWSKPNRKLLANYPDVILPSWKDKEKEKIFCAIDASGSIDMQALSLFINVLRSTPRRFEINAITFNTECFKYDVFGKDQPVGGGGTDFSIIEKYIQDNFKKYPAAVFVLTDGYGTAVKPEHPDRWGWLLYGASSKEYCATMKHYNIMDLLVEKK